MQKCPKQGDALSLLFFNFSQKYSIRNVRESEGGMKLNRTNKVLPYADDVNILEENVDTIKNNTS
jgi:hypothetical protein